MWRVNVIQCVRGQYVINMSYKTPVGQYLQQRKKNIYKVFLLKQKDKFIASKFE